MRQRRLIFRSVGGACSGHFFLIEGSLTPPPPCERAWACVTQKWALIRGEMLYLRESEGGSYYERKCVLIKKEKGHESRLKTRAKISEV